MWNWLCVYYAFNPAETLRDDRRLVNEEGNQWMGMDESMSDVFEDWYIMSELIYAKSRGVPWPRSNFNEVLGDIVS